MKTSSSFTISVAPVRFPPHQEWILSDPAADPPGVGPGTDMTHTPWSPSVDPRLAQE